ncbi:MAG: F0F1 ATP synthase subunit A [Dysgonamonadaceae bacterium]|jgi:F-type H+-transporting ATPase subunit a|nr:F0F1 ATP synthase subunit A [Dysgonamonadaceae bacterium]
MSDLIQKTTVLFLLFLFVGINASPAETPPAEENTELNVSELILEHVGDGYDWHITNLGHNPVSIPLPVIVKGKESGWHLFLSSAFHHGHASCKGFSIAQEGPYKGKIIETLATGDEVRPWDFSLTKNATSLLLSSIILIILIVSCANWYRKRQENPENCSPKGFVAFVELVIMSIVDGVIKPCIGKNYKRYTPYLLTVFFFIIFNNLLGLIPLFPGGANVTGNIAITCVLALFTFAMVNIFGTKEYWKEIFWPDVPAWLKVPVPIMPAVEFLGIFTKPFALMIRLFASILSGHALILGLTCMVFLTVRLGVFMNTGMTVFAVILTVFSDCVELLVAYIQAYVFTMLSAVYIGLSQVEAHHKPKSEKSR